MFCSEKVTEKFTNLYFPNNLLHFYTIGMHKIYLGFPIQIHDPKGSWCEAFNQYVKDEWKLNLL